MFRHFSKLLWALAFVLGLAYFAHGFTFNPRPVLKERNIEKNSDLKIQTGLDIRNISHHLLDFYK